MIAAANKEVEKIVIKGSTKKKGCHQKFTPKQKALIGNYALINGTSATHRHYVGEFPGLKYTTICDWRKAISEQQQKEHEAVTELHGKKRGRPPTLPDKVVTYVMKYIHAVQWRRKLSKSGGANLLNKNYFYGKNLNPMEHS